ncbi:MAG: hypothetical protein AAF698_09010 [Pseudomonadota bacterium]
MAALLVLSGCGTVGLFGLYDVPESEGVADTPYPRLVDVPEAPPPGSFTEAVPDPAQGVAVTVDLTAAAQAQNAEAQRIDEPVLSEDERGRLGR